MQQIQLLERTIPGLHQSLLDNLPKFSYDTPILDIGCGTGAWLERLSNTGFTNLYGIDKNIEQVGTKKASCWAADIDWDDNLGLNDKKFGLITAIEILEHLENPGRFYHHVSKHLADNGYCILTTPNIHSVDCRFKFLLTERLKSFDYKGDPTHVYPVLLNSVYRILPHHSLKIVNKWGYPAKGSLATRKSTQIISAVLKVLLSEETNGDTLCLLIQKVNN